MFLTYAMIGGMKWCKTKGDSRGVPERLEDEARKEAKQAASWERQDRWVSVFLIISAAGFSGAGGATVFANHTTVGAILALVGSLAATINAALRPAERQRRQLRQRADLLRLADKLALLRDPQAKARENELKPLVNDLAEIRARGFVEGAETPRSYSRGEQGQSAPSHAEIAARAYDLYEQGAAGDAAAHWLAAEQEVTRPSQ
jgi:phosphate/sulfate permease